MACDVDSRLGKRGVAIASQIVHLNVDDDDGHDSVVHLHGSASLQKNCEVGVCVIHEVQYFLYWRVHVLERVILSA